MMKATFIRSNDFQAAVFDMDGLLLDTERLALNAFRELCAVHQMDVHDDVYYACVGCNAPTIQTILHDKLCGKMDGKSFLEKWTAGFNKLANASPIPLKKGVKELLETFSTGNLPMAVATSTTTKVAENHLKHVDILKYFQTVVGGDQVKHSKPAPDIYLKAAKTLAVPESQCLAFEDSPNGVRAAVAAGMRVFQVPDMIEPSKDLLTLNHTVITSLLEVPKYVKI